MSKQLRYQHVDVFSAQAYGGNSLPVFTDTRDLSNTQMLAITQELRHFEAIFLEPATAHNLFRTHVFDLFGELPFAGHPIIGAAAVLHRDSGLPAPQTWYFELSGKTVSVTTEATEHGYFGMLDQGAPEFLGLVDDQLGIAKAFDLDAADLHDTLPLEVVSTGLRYLIVPLRAGVIGRARISIDISRLIETFGAQFAVLFDAANFEIRHWNNDGIIEDIATGSAAGTIGAYCLKHGCVSAGTPFILQQGRYAGRPSKLRVQPEGSAENILTVKVGGDVAFVGHGTIQVPPP